MSKILCICLLIVTFACTQKQNTAEGVLNLVANAFVEKNVDKEFYLEHTTGKMNLEIAEMNQEELEDYFSFGSPTKMEMKIIKQNCAKDFCNITYLVSYSEKGENGEGHLVETKKIAELRLDNGSWKIASITNQKGFVETKKPIEINN